MDGINGITVFYALVSLGTFYWVPELQADQDWILLVGLSCLIFAGFNARKKALVFAGDVGSVSMALILGYLMVKTILLTGNPWYLFFFSLYGVDAGLTLLIRLRKGENVLEPHRSHLYQFLANEKNFPTCWYPCFMPGFNWESIGFGYRGLGWSSFAGCPE